MSKQLDKANKLLSKVIEGNYDKVNTHKIEPQLRVEIEEYLTENY